MARAAVEWFAERMEEKLRRNDGVKVPWETGIKPAIDLYDDLITEVMELHSAMCCYLDNPNPETAHAVVMEAADVGNYAMMIASMHDGDNSRLERGRVLVETPGAMHALPVGHDAGKKAS